MRAPLNKNFISLAILLCTVITAVLLITTHHSSSNPTTSATADNWRSQYASAVKTLLDDNQKAANDTSMTTLPALETDCRNINNDIDAVKKLPAIPIAGAEKHKNNMLTYFGLAATDCISGSHDGQTGIQSNDNALIDKAAQEIASATSYLSQAKTEVDAFNASF